MEFSDFHHDFFLHEAHIANNVIIMIHKILRHCNCCTFPLKLTFPEIYVFSIRKINIMIIFIINIERVLIYK